jgi:biopolymer transport protein ExbD
MKRDPVPLYQFSATKEEGVLFQPEHDEDIKSDINIVPLVDIMLVLLITFMMVSTLVDLSAIKVALPKAATAESAENKSLAIVITKTGDYFLSGEPMISLDELQTKIEQKRAQEPGLQAIVSADKSVSHGEVIKVIDLIRKLEITKFAISVELEEEPRQ